MTVYIVMGKDWQGRYYLSRDHNVSFWTIDLAQAERFHSIESAKRSFYNAPSVNLLIGESIMTLGEAEVLEIMDQ